MIKIIERKEEPRATVNCPNCGSLLEYGNSDVIVEKQDNPVSILYRYFLECPVCLVSFPVKLAKKDGV